MKVTHMKASLRLFLPLFLVFLSAQCLGANEGESFARERKKMVEEQIVARGVKDSSVLRAMETVPRHLFVPEDVRAYSYLDTPLPIGSGQTISQPYIVAFMTELLALNKEDKVLEIGTGSGYQAAILSPIVREVHTIEIKRDLAKRAREILQRLGYDNVTVYAGDGYLGLPGEAPFDAIMITAATPEIPPALLDQLGLGGRMVLPVGQPSRTQNLTLITKKPTGEISKESLAPVLFVPLTRD